MTKCQKEQKYLFELALKEKKNHTCCHTTDTLCSQMVTKWSASPFLPQSISFISSAERHKCHIWCRNERGNLLNASESMKLRSLWGIQSFLFCFFPLFSFSFSGNTKFLSIVPISLFIHIDYSPIISDVCLSLSLIAVNQRQQMT